VETHPKKKKKKKKREGGEIKTQFCIKEKRCARNKERPLNVTKTFLPKRAQETEL
jgi:hypothetical protein